jgi:hypothetical protein
MPKSSSISLSNRKPASEIRKIEFRLWQVPEILSDSWRPDSVIPAEAGIQVFQYVLDPGFRRGDEQGGQSFPDKIIDNCHKPFFRYSDIPFAKPLALP